MDVASLREDIPGLEDVTYLNTGAASPSPRSVVTAIESALERHEFESPRGEGMYPPAYEWFDEARKAIAPLLGTDADRITLTNSTTDGLNLIAGGFEWGPDDVVVTTDLEHPSGRLPWGRHAAEVRLVENEAGYFDLDDVKDAVAGAAVVCVSSVAWNYGTRLPVSEIVDIARDAGACTVVDCAQSPGQRPVAVEEWGADFVAGTGHKWVLGPWGAGFLYVRDGAEEYIPAHRIGAKSVTDFEYDTGTFEFRPGARRFQSGTLSPPLQVGLATAAGLLLDVGLSAITDRIEELTDRLKAGLDEEQLLSPMEYESGIVSFTTDDPQRTMEDLEREGIKTRAIPDPSAVRATVHAFNTEGDIDRLLEHV